MANQYYMIKIIGNNGADITAKGSDGIPGTPSPSPNGDPGQDQTIDNKKTCKVPATNGHDGVTGGNAPNDAQNGGNGDNSYSLLMKCSEFTGPTFSLLSQGGNGGKGGDGGTGGKGGDAGNGGLQSTACMKSYGDSKGGIGGSGGTGGKAGNGGNAGSGGNITITYDETMTAPTWNLLSNPGNPGSYGTPGAGGDPGLGGLPGNGDLSKRNISGSKGSGGAPGSYGNPGGKGNTIINTASSPQYKFVVEVST